MDVVALGETMVLFSPQTKGKLRYVRNYSSRMAGAESNTLIGLARLGHKTGWISRVGDDEFGSFILSAIRGEGVDTSQVIKDEKSPTGIFFKEEMNESNIEVFYYRKNSAASFLSPQDVNEEYILNAKFIYITGITPALSESCYDTIFHVINLAKRKGKKVIFDPNLRKKLWSEERAREVLLSIIDEVDIVLPSLEEGNFLFGTDNCEELAGALHERGVDTVIIKRGKDGAYFSTSEENGYVNGFTIDRVVDPIGSGDGFAAGVISGMLDGLPMESLVERGCAIGAIIATVPGDIEGIPDRDMLTNFINSPNSADDVSR